MGLTYQDLLTPLPQRKELSRGNPDVDLSFLVAPWEMTRESATGRQIHPKSRYRQTVFQALSSCLTVQPAGVHSGIILPSGGRGSGFMFFILNVSPREAVLSWTITHGCRLDWTGGQTGPAAPATS